MASFTWEESTLTADCRNLQEMAKRFEDAAVLMRRMDQCNFELENDNGIRRITHENVRMFSRFGFVADKVLIDSRKRGIEIDSK